MRGLLVNDIPKYITLSIWLGINGLLFGITFRNYNTDKKYFYTRILLGVTLPISRGSAACLNFNCMLILLPVCRNLLSYVRGRTDCCHGGAKRVLDKNITFHRICAYMIVFMTLIHYFGHSVNVHRFSTASEEILDITKDAESQIRTKVLIELATTGGTEEDSYLNPIREPKYPIASAFTLTGGWSGIIMSICLFLMLTSSTEFIRRSYFEIFWYVHHTFIIFFAFLFFHGVHRQVRGQSNTDQHDPEHCSTVDPDNWSKDTRCSTPPRFTGSAPITWAWIAGPVILYAFERILRFVRFLQPVELLKVVKHPSKVIEIQMRKKDFSAEVGQYIFIQCPALSNFEWHPFTLTSAPEENYLSVHIRIVGDWTSGLSRAVGAEESGPVQPSSKMPRIAIDGPFGTASEDVFEYDVALCVGSGIGVTPFASLLKSVFYKTVNNSITVRLKKVYFFWICPDTHAFEWFGDMLIHLENQLAENERRDLIEYHIYLTRGWSANQARAIFIHDEDDRDVITGLEQKTNYGRPNWDEVFSKIAAKHEGMDIGVFFCGVAQLSRTLHKMCNKHSTSKVSFHYNKENF